jgi:anti-anti-sigma factor
MVIQAPVDLDGKTRNAFRDKVLAAIEAISSQAGTRIIIDLGATRRIDSAALGMLVMLQLRAAEKRLAVCLRNVSEEVRFLLLMTRLEDRFEIEGGPAV